MSRRWVGATHLVGPEMVVESFDGVGSLAAAPLLVEVEDDPGQGAPS